jgi:hypothetical protein
MKNYNDIFGTSLKLNPAPGQLYKDIRSGTYLLATDEGFRVIDENGREFNRDRHFFLSDWVPVNIWEVNLTRVA